MSAPDPARQATPRPLSEWTCHWEEAAVFGSTRHRESDATTETSGIETIALLVYDDPATGRPRFAVWEIGADRPSRAVTADGPDPLHEVYEQWVRARAQRRPMRTSDVPGCSHDSLGEGITPEWGNLWRRPRVYSAAGSAPDTGSGTVFACLPSTSTSPARNTMSCGRPQPPRGCRQRNTRAPAR